MANRTDEVLSATVVARLEDCANRLLHLLEEAAHESGPSDAAIDLLNELSMAAEELRVAEEEIVIQGEQLTSSYQAIDDERERFLSLFDAAPDAFLETDPMGKILEANENASRLTGVSSRFLAGKLIQSFLEVEDRRAMRLLLAAMQHGAGPQDVLVQLTPRDGKPRWVEIRLVSHARPGTGTPTVLWILREVTDRIELEREVIKLRTSVQLLEALATVTRLVEGENLLDTVLQTLVELGSRMAHADAAIMLVGPDGTVRARAGFGEAAEEIGLRQIETWGPTMDVSRDGLPRSVSIDDLNGLEAWPELAEVLRRHGVQAIISQPITIDDAPAGAFNLYLRGPMDENAAVVARLLATNAAGAISNAELYSGARHLASQLATALESRGVIDQAKGILMAAQRCTPDEAFDILRRASQRENRKLRVIAENVVARIAKNSG